MEDRETLHELNRRYQQAWNRAEHLQDELNDIKNSRAYRFFHFWRRLTGCWRKDPRQGTLDRRPFPMENLEKDQVPAKGTVSIVIPFKNGLDLLQQCLRSLKRGTYPLREIILVDNGSTSPRLLRYLDHLRARTRFKILSCPGPFNFSRLGNLGAQQAKGRFLVFLNNDVEVQAPDWLEHLLQLGRCPRIGIVGATLLYPDRTLQHAGIFPLANGQWSHAYRGLPHDHRGDEGELSHARTVPAVTGACLLIRRALFAAVGGFDESYGVTFNDVDLCLRIRERGLKVAISPRARLWHLESMTRGLSRSEPVNEKPFFHTPY